MPNYWIISSNVRNDLSQESAWIEAMKKTKCVFMGWPCNESHGVTFCRDVQIGDIILIARREKWVRKLTAIGRVKTDADSSHLSEVDGLAYGAYRKLYPFLPLETDPSNYNMNFNGTAYGDAQTIPAIYKLHPEKNNADAALSSIFEQLLFKQEEYEKMTNFLVSSEQARMDLLLDFHQVILHGPPGTSKTYQAKRMAAKLILDKTGEEVDNLVNQEEKRTGEFADKRFRIIWDQNKPDKYEGQWAIVQFHPAYNYEDFVRGIQVSGQDEKIKYENVQRIFSAMCKAAENDSGKNYVLIIDEINRAHIAAVLGELIYGLEYRNARITTPYAIEGDNTLSVPDNLYIIGTMNTADRSIGHIDYAVRRRFAFIACPPDPIALKNYYEDKSEALRRLAEQLFEAVRNIFNKENLNEFDMEDVCPGHTYFMAENEPKLRNKFIYQVYPLLREYYKDGILRQNITQMKLTNGNMVPLDRAVSPDKLIDLIQGASPTSAV